MSNPEDNNLPQPQAPAPVKQTKSASVNWPLGLAIVVIGGLLLARNLGFELFFLDFHNWWAFFILLAAIGPLQQAFSFYRKEGLGAAVANSLVSAGAIVFIALMFLLDMSFGTWWPIFVIIGGLYMMTSRDRS
ncbi:MAG: hypothetical protein Q7T48_13645 [Cellvibrio sp.]|uniref:LiaF transmembrane domain-containing protein n=1 Tax=Cellvibrio sp. TaxID=1965322 RepID=UPI002727F9D9|nr:hypothetical protein [Cellvibrio sp.]